MTDPSKIKPTHTQRAAYVYIRQSTPGQVEHNRESTARQYALADRACQLGWPKEQVVIIDEDLGLSGSSTDKRSGFTRLTSEVALAHVGIVLGLEVSRLARNNADWYRLLELCGVTDTLIGDNDGVYHPALFNPKWGKCAGAEAQRALTVAPELAETHETMAAVHRWSTLTRSGHPGERPRSGVESQPAPASRRFFPPPGPARPGRTRSPHWARELPRRSG